MNRLVVAAVALTFVAIGPNRGFAQPKKKKLTWKQKRKARSYVLRGNRFKAMGDRYRWKKRKALSMKNYKKAAYVYIAAYRISEQSSLIYKLANVYMVRGEMSWALRGYKRFVELRPKGRTARRAKRLIKRLERVVAAQRKAGTLVKGDEQIDPLEAYGDAPDEDEPPDKDPDPPEKKDPDPPDKKKPVKKKIVKVSKPKPPTPGRNFRLGGIGTAAAGVILMAVGFKFGLDARSASSDLSGNEDAWTDEDRQRIKDGESASNKFFLFTLAGSAAVVGGALLYLHGKKLGKRGRKEVTVAPAVTPNSVSLSILGRF